MKKSMSGRNMQIKFSKNMAGENAIFLYLSGNSSECIYTKKGALNFAKYLREAAKLVKDNVKYIGDK